MALVVRNILKKNVGSMKLVLFKHNNISGRAFNSGSRLMGKFQKNRFPTYNLLNVLKRGRHNNSVSVNKRGGVLNNSMLFRNGLMRHCIDNKSLSFPMTFASINSLSKRNFSGKGDDHPFGKPIKSLSQRRRSIYLRGLTNFTFPLNRERFSKEQTKENLEFGYNWVKENLLTKSSARPTNIETVDEITSESVLALKQLTEQDDIIRMLIERMFDEAGGILGRGLNVPSINDLDSLLVALENNLTFAPEAKVSIDENGNYVDESVTTPLALVYGPLAMTESGEALSYYPKMNTWWKSYLNAWKLYLDSPASTNVIAGWLEEPAYSYLNMDDYINKTSADAYYSWNDFFIREISPNVRSMDEGVSGDNTKVVSAVDANVWSYEENLTIDRKFWIKQQPYDLKTLLGNDDELINRYTGGTLLQCVLFPDDYHRWRAPVTGTVSRAQIIGNTYWTNINYTLDSDTSALSSWTGSVPYMSHLNVRGLIEIDTSASTEGNIGKVLFIQVGLNEISSVIQKVGVNDKVEKFNTELGNFQYGGSTVIYIFEPNVINSTSGWVINKPESGNEAQDPMHDDYYQVVQLGNTIFNATQKTT